MPNWFRVIIGSMVTMVWAFVSVSASMTQMTVDVWYHALTGVILFGLFPEGGAALVRAWRGKGKNGDGNG